MHIAIIAEYNPFHNGHAYQIDDLRARYGADAAVTVILGGIFSQRGEPYIAPPYVRAEAALRCGADLVLELPFPFSAAPASIFARAGVEIAAKIGADVLAFGSECGDIDLLYATVEKLDSTEMQAALDAAKDEAAGKTRLYPQVYKSLYGEELSTGPNDILAMEYLRAIRASGAPLTPYTIRRKGDYKSGEGGFASASVLRRAYAEHGSKALCGEMPDSAYSAFEKASEKGLFAPDFEKLCSAVLLTLADATDGIAFSGSGLTGHLAKCASGAKSIAALQKKAATKRYTDAEIARGILYALLNVTAADMDAPVRYTRVLGMRENGKKILASPLQIEVLTKPSATQKLSDEAKEQYEKTFAAERAYALTLRGEYDHLRQTPVIL